MNEPFPGVKKDIDCSWHDVAKELLRFWPSDTGHRAPVEGGAQGACLWAIFEQLCQNKVYEGVG